MVMMLEEEDDGQELNMTTISSLLSVSNLSSFLLTFQDSKESKKVNGSETNLCFNSSMSSLFNESPDSISEKDNEAPVDCSRLASLFTAIEGTARQDEVNDELLIIDRDRDSALNGISSSSATLHEFLMSSVATFLSNSSDMDYGQEDPDGSLSPSFTILDSDIMSSYANGTREMSPTGETYNWLFLLLGLLVFIGGLGNVLVCLAVCFERRLQNATNYFLLSLSVADLFVSILVMPIAIFDEFYGMSYLFFFHYNTY